MIEDFSISSEQIKNDFGEKVEEIYVFFYLFWITKISWQMLERN